MEFIHDGVNFKQLELSSEDSERFVQYLKTMGKGLYLSRIDKAVPSEPEILFRQYRDLDLHGGRESFFKPIREICKPRDPNFFGQRWNNIIYFGSRVSETPDKGYIFIEFYNEFGVLVTFD